MAKVVTLRDFLKEYGIKKDDFMKVIDEDRAFYDKYIEWEQFDDATIITPKALGKLGEVFNKDNTEKNTMKITRDGEVKAEVELSTDAPVKSKRKRRTKAEIEADRLKSESNQLDMSDYMEKPIKEEKAPTPKKEVKTPKKTLIKPKKKKSKMNITKQFIQEHGFINEKTPINMSDLRSALMDSGIYRTEQMAVMTDQEIKDGLNKDFFFIESKDNITYIFPRKVMNGSINSIYVIEG